MGWRDRISAAAWIVARDTHAAEDIFQNVTIKALQSKVDFDSEGNLLSWAFVTARREAIDWLRKHKREIICLEADVLGLIEQEWQNQPQSRATEKIEALRSCFESAPSEARQLLKLRYYDGRQCEEVARQLGLNVSAIYKRLSRLHESLRQCVEKKLAKVERLGEMN